MKNKLLAVLLCSATAISAESKFQGVHLTAQAGMKSSKHTASIIGPTATGTSKEILSRPHVSLSHFSGGFALGYLHEVMNNIYAGAEIEYNFGSGSGDIGISVLGEPSVYNLKVKSGANYAGSLVLGYAFDSVLPFVKLGYGVNKYKVNYSRKANANVGTTSGSVSGSNNLSGFRLGLGAQIAATDCLHFGLEYGYNFGSKKKDYLIDGASVGAGGTYRKARVESSAAQSVMLRLTYRFGM